MAEGQGFEPRSKVLETLVLTLNYPSSKSPQVCIYYRGPRELFIQMAEAAGFEPADKGVKVPCLTAWPCLFIMVGMAGFEPAVSRSQGERIAKLCYIPIL